MSTINSQHSARGTKSLASPSIILIAVAAVVAGLSAAIVPWWLLVIFFVLPALGFVATVWPYLGLLGLVSLIAGIVPSEWLPQISVGSGKLLGTDMALGTLLGLVILKALFNGNEVLKAARPYLIPILLFLASIPLCSAVGFVFFHTEAREVLNEARVQVYWLVFFLPIYFLARSTDLNRVAWGLVVVGVTLAAMVVIQFAFGVHLLENGRMEDLRTMGATYTNVTRSTAGGAIYLIIFAMYFLVARLLTKSLHPLIVLPLVAILAAGILATFGRGIWLASAVGLCGIAWHLGGLRALQKLAMVMLVGGMMGIGSLATFNPAVIDATFERFTSTFSEGNEKTSLGERFEENGFAIKKIASSPLFGIGFGTPYKPRLDPGVDWKQVRYIHNAYLGLWMKLGLLGPIAATWLTVIVFRRAKRLLLIDTLQPQYRAFATACLVSFFVPVVTSFTQPEWLTSLGVSFFALMAGLLAVLEYHAHPTEKVTT